jgi:hypothetical protein
MRFTNVFITLADALNTTLPLWMKVVTSLQPAASNAATKRGMGIMFLPLTLMPRSRAT